VFLVSGFWLRSCKNWFFVVFLFICVCVSGFLLSYFVMCFLISLYVFLFPGSSLIIISGNNYSCFCKNDSGWFKKDLASWVLPFLGCLLSAPEVKLSLTPTLPFLVSVYVMYVLMMLLIWFLLLFLFLQLDWLNQHLTKIWPYVDQVFCYYGVSLFF